MPPREIRPPAGHREAEETTPCDGLSSAIVSLTGGTVTS
jgi:hypothetical protein